MSVPSRLPRPRSPRRLAAALAFATLALAVPAPDRARADPVTTKADEAARFFRDGPVPTLKITVPDEGLAKWKEDPRAYVECTVSDGKTVYEGVGIKLKGAIGSFRSLDDKPALTLRFAKFGGDVMFHGMEKVYLNNSVQDETYLHEWLGSELFRAAGIPAPRVTHARVWLNGRDIGLHLCKEGHDKRFLRRHFEDPSGTLYDGGLGQDIDSELERDEGPGPNDHKELQDLLYACEDTDAVRARPGIQAHLDVDKFLTFMALERMVGHWDGYNWNRNNYRLYFDKTHRGVFVPHGMDQLFADPNLSVFDEPVSIVGTAVMRDAEWAAAYHQRIGELLAVFNPVDRWTKRMDEVVARLKPAVAGTAGPQNVGGLKTRFAARVKSLTAQAKQPAPKPIELAQGEDLKLRSWRPVPGGEGMKLQQVSFSGERVLRFECPAKGAEATGTWRTKLLLMPGKYRLDGSFMVDDVATAGDPGKTGLWIKVLDGPQSEHLSGKGTWKPLSVEFDVADQPRQVEVLLELKATKGTAYVRLFSLSLTRL